jgi:RHS repeat-associated protein
MKGICDKAVNKLATLEKYNGGNELDEVSTMYETYYRGYDQQIGRFRGVDIQAEGSVNISTYQFGFDNPISSNDPLGNHPRTMNWQDYQEQGGQAPSFDPREWRSMMGGGGEYDWSGINAMEKAAGLAYGINDLVNSGINGTWSASRGFTIFSSNEQALGYAWNNRIGDNAGWAKSFEEAMNRYDPGYRKNGGTYNYDGGKVQNWTNDNGGKFSIFTDSKGIETAFSGATITDFGVSDGYGYTTANGAIHASTSFDLAHLEHEYGHYLQALNYGEYTYNYKIVPASVWNMWFGSDHSNFWTEKDANAWASLYFGPGSPIWKDNDLFPKEWCSYMNDYLKSH